MKSFLTLILYLLGASLSASGSAMGEIYDCQLTANPGVFYRAITWNGTTPFQSAIEYNHRPGLFKVSSIGLAGHPDYLFEIKVGNRTLMAVSQEKYLKDYNLSWRSDQENASDALINVACRLRPGL